MREYLDKRKTVYFQGPQTVEICFWWIYFYNFPFIFEYIVRRPAQCIHNKSVRADPLRLPFTYVIAYYLGNLLLDHTIHIPIN